MEEEQGSARNGNEAQPAQKGPLTPPNNRQGSLSRVGSLYCAEAVGVNQYNQTITACKDFCFMECSSPVRLRCLERALDLQTHRLLQPSCPPACPLEASKYFAFRALSETRRVVYLEQANTLCRIKDAAPASRVLLPAGDTWRWFNAPSHWPCCWRLIHCPPRPLHTLCTNR